MSNRAKTILLILGDLACLLLALTATIAIKTSGNWRHNYFEAHFELFLFVYPFWFLIFFIEGLYALRTYNPAALPVSLLRSISLNLAGSYVIIYLLPTSITKLTPKTNLIIISLISLVLLYGWRKLFQSFFSDVRRNRGVLVIGSDTTTELVCAEIKRKPYLGYRIVRTMKTEHAVQEKLPEGVELIAIERGSTKDTVLLQQIFNLLGTVEIIDLAKFAEKISGKIPLESIDETWFIEYCGHQESRSYDILKSLLDRSVALLLLVLLIPVALVLIPLLLVVHGRPLLFTQTRTGLNNKPFTLYKLRSMVRDAEKTGVQWAKPGDARITPMGKVLRKTRLDELPQLLNILKGEMSLVGPRPERPEIIEKQLAPTIPFYNLRHMVKPGVTGWAQVTFRYGYSTEDSLEKLQYDLFYVKNRNLFLDVIVILKTIKTVLTGAGQ
jgi:exopolysaccharide biosynthesis polyprenyl glycosylphosphotransferase